MDAHAPLRLRCPADSPREDRIAALETALRAVLDLAPEGGTPWVAAMARAQRVLDGGAR